MTENLKKPCCIPGREARAHEVAGPATVADPGQGAGGARLLAIPGGEFPMGSDAPDGFPEDGEGPCRRVGLDGFLISATAVTNRQFRKFIHETRYITEAERFGSSFVFYLQAPESIRHAVRVVPDGLAWWLPVAGACWQRPEGPGSHIYDRLDHPVVHVSWSDARAYCDWSGQRLPTEAEWECAARGGLSAKKYPWGDELEPEGRPRCNIWQGMFPNQPAEGWRPGTLPARSFEPNGFGLYSAVGNVWEWCEDWFSPAYHLETTGYNPKFVKETGRRSMRGGSFLCHDSYCNRYRVAARSSNTPSSSSGNCGFRVAASPA
jgi:sulfatase modifying factor 1